MTFPSPPQFWHVAMLTNWPNTERDTWRISPDPLHTVQAVILPVERAPVPPQTSHRFHFFIFSFFSIPEAISSSGSFSRILRSDPAEPALPRVRVRP